LDRCTLWGVGVALAAATFTSGTVQAQTWSAFGQISPTLGNNKGRLCVGDTNSDLGCPTYAPSLTTAGDVSVTGGISAARFIGDGSGLTGLSAANVSVTTGASGSLVYRDAFGSLVASSGLSISSTTGSVGIGAGAPSLVGNNSLYASGNLQSGNHLFLGGTSSIFWAGDSTTKISGDAASGKYLSFFTSGTEAMRIVSTGMVGIGTSAPSSTLHVYSVTQPYPSALIQGPNPLYDLQTTAGTGYMALRFRRSSSIPWSIGTDSSSNGFLYVSPNQSVPDISGSALVMTGSGMVGISVRQVPSATLHIGGTLRADSNTEIRGTVSATILKLADSPSDPCNASNIGAIKVINGAIYTCRQ
jgi:hypothetical protein